MTIVWRNHYTALVVPPSPQSPPVVFDPNGPPSPSRMYEPPPLDVVGEALLPGNMPPLTVLSWNPQGQDESDVFCSAWTLWFLTHGYWAWRDGVLTEQLRLPLILRYLQDLVNADRPTVVMQKGRRRPSPTTPTSGNT